MKTWLFTILVFLLLTTPVTPQNQSQGSLSVKPVASDPTTPATELAEAEALNSQVMSLYHAGYYKEAVPLANRVLLLREKILGPDHWLVAEALRSLSELFSAMGKSKEA